MEDIIIFLGIAFNLNLPLLTAWLLDHWLGDPVWLPHPVVVFGKAISFCEHRLNKGNARFLKGAVMSLVLVAGVYLLTLFLLRWAAHYSPGLLLTLQVLLIFYCLAGTTLVREVCGVFKAVDRSLEEGRKQVARIVGRDASRTFGTGSTYGGIRDVGGEPERRRNRSAVLVYVAGCAGDACL